MYDKFITLYLEKLGYLEVGNKDNSVSHNNFPVLWSEGERWADRSMDLTHWDVSYNRLLVRN